MLGGGEHVLVALSGGCDSTALLLCLQRLAPVLGLGLTVAHFNHGLRGAESDRDEEFARSASVDLGLPFVSERADVAALASARPQNLEEAARDARYEFLRRAACGAGARKIATGHNLNDQAETVLLRLMRGSGPAGLEAIHPVLGGSVVRPLIECSRSRILKYLEGRHAQYREDATNLDLNRRRNRVRHELIPYLEKHFNPSLVSALAREAGLARDIDDFLEAAAAKEYAAMSLPVPDGIRLPAGGLAGLHPALRRQIVRHALREVLGSGRGVGTAHVDAILRLCGRNQSGRHATLPRRAEARRNLEWVELRRAPAVKRPTFRYELTWPGSCRIPEAGLEFSAALLEGPSPDGSDAANSALFNPDSLPRTLTVRSKLPGDRYGGPGHRKVKKMLLSARIPDADRMRLPMIVVGDSVIWIPGFKPAKLFTSKPGSGRSVLMTVRRIPSER